MRFCYAAMLSLLSVIPIRTRPPPRLLFSPEAVPRRLDEPGKLGSPSRPHTPKRDPMNIHRPLCDCRRIISCFRQDQKTPNKKDSPNSYLASLSTQTIHPPWQPCGHSPSGRSTLQGYLPSSLSISRRNYFSSLTVSRLT
ncbi:hypothetical protein B0T10DRAFT_17707 [Thelonectria olida]|uniref:Secreted protein n=1 Tax=Thelonectria olida TaxID=1576542 RepID=A0A9P8WHR8_9HYPO|nr:hypothetical protein B0T10DRAFT_17707 [Thelonectria olida]